MSSSDRQFDYNDRYGIRESKAWVRYATFFAIIGGSWLTWAGLHHSNPDLRSDLISFTTVDPRNPTIRYSIQRRDGGNTVTCTLTARDLDKNIVGQIDDEIQAGAKYIERTIAIPTRADAVNVGIARCRIR